MKSTQDQDDHPKPHPPALVPTCKKHIYIYAIHRLWPIVTHVYRNA